MIEGGKLRVMVRLSIRYNHARKLVKNDEWPLTRESAETESEFLRRDSAQLPVDLTTQGRCKVDRIWLPAESKRKDDLQRLTNPTEITNAS